MNLRPALFEFFTVQLSHGNAKRGLLRGYYLHLGSLPIIGASLCLISAVLADRRRGEIDRLMRELPEGGLLETFGVSVDAYLSRRIDHHQALHKDYLAKYPASLMTIDSFLDYVTRPWRNVFAAAGRAGKLIWTGGEIVTLMPELVAPENPDLLYGSEARVAYDENITLKLPMLFGELGMAFGHLQPEASRKLAIADINVPLEDWSKAKSYGFNLPERPPFVSLSQLADVLDAEVNYFYDLHGGDPSARPSTVSNSQYATWTSRDFGRKVLSIYAFYGYKRLSNALSRRGDI